MKSQKNYFKPNPSNFPCMPLTFPVDDKISDWIAIISRFIKCFHTKLQPCSNKHRRWEEIQIANMCDHKNQMLLLLQHLLYFFISKHLLDKSFIRYSWHSFQWCLVLVKGPASQSVSQPVSQPSSHMWCVFKREEKSRKIQQLPRTPD